MPELPGKIWLGFLTACGMMLVGVPSTGRAQKSEEVQFETADKVELRGTFYPSSKAKAPCVIMLHKFGGNRQQNGWEQLAAALQKDFAVLSFDFRGHGDSTSVSTSFWQYPNNLLIKGAGRQPTKISHKDFAPQYMPVLANDVAAAKRYLDDQNDAGVCNASNVVVIGAEEGAAIGALWIASEWQRLRLTKDAFGRYLPDRQRTTEGEDIASAVWLSMPKFLGQTYVGLWLKGRVRDRVGMVFFYGEQDYKARAAAVGIFEDVKRSGRDKLELSRTRGKETKLAGNELLQKSLKTIDDITTYLEKVMQKRGLKAPFQRESKKTPFVLIPFSQLGIPLR